VGEARRLATSVAARAGLSEGTRSDVGIVATELATNVVRHAGNGTLLVRQLEGGGGGIELLCLDAGPGMRDPAACMADGFSTTGSLGYGLGTVNRVMDELETTIAPGGQGLRLVCRRWLRPKVASARPCPLAFGVATRPYPGQVVNGDAFVVKRWGESALVGVIDGLGHGQGAHEAAEAARQYVEDHSTQPLEALFRGTARACASTRGVVMALARFDCAAWKLTFASVGNVEARVFGSPQSLSFMIRRGVLGLNAPRAVVTEHPWRPDHVLVLHSDGLRTHWRWENFPDLALKPPEVIAQGLLRALAKDEDDATVIVVRGNLT
jgi:anti-sigma regulatory factor (Ser/Thr protein kinase)